jgi:hypothetical protein
MKLQAMRHWALRHRRPACMALVLLAARSGCAGYRFGNATLFPADIRTVYVPVFESSSFRRNLGEQLTEAVVKEIEKRTPYKVVADPNADSVLTGRIGSETKNLIQQTLNGDPREVEVHLLVKVTWLDRRSNIIRQCPPVAVPPACVSVGGTSDIVPEVGQSIATGQQQAIKQLAQQIVSLMEAPW